MFKKLFGYQALTNEEELFFLKANQYLIKNCNAIYGTEYLPRLIQRICSTIGIYVECHKGIITITKDDKRYEVEHGFNVFKGQIIDLGLFVIKESYKREESDSENSNQFIEVPIFPDLPSYIISGDKNSNLPENIVYESKKLILNKDFQPSIVLEDDKLILAVYNNCIASNIAKLILESELETGNNIKSDIQLKILGEILVSNL